MAAMPAPVHEQVQERTSGEQNPWQRPQQMCPMLGPEEERGDRQENAQRNAGGCGEEASAGAPLLDAHACSPRLTSARARSSSLALMATMTVLSDMKAAPSAGVSSTPQG